MSRKHALTQAVGDTFTQSFYGAIKKLATIVGTSSVNEGGTPISSFRAQYAHVLNRTDAGSLEVITRNNRRYVILNEAQLVALTKNVHLEPLAAELLSDLALLPATGDKLRSRLPNSSFVRLSRLPG